jgi:hypothetical protein
MDKGIFFEVRERESARARERESEGGRKRERVKEKWGERM